MKMTDFKKSLSTIICFVLITAMALMTIGCQDNSDKQNDNVGGNEVTDKTVLGEGSTVFDFTVTGLDGKTNAFEIHTDKTTVGDALLELGLIAGDAGDYGLYVKTVNGVTVDYDTDGKYWAFYINGEYGMTGVDLTEITEGETYSFKAE
ncbi:MAG: DUF4430 domain-containing protein [Ruminococcaceae bacterium]|nr:DUF4430 domain-containing protein [Oscillospiraceae bacterium]